MYRKVIIIMGILLGVCCLFSCSKRTINHYDILIKGGRIVNGTGNPWFYADVGIRGDVIAAIGCLDADKADTVIHAEGLVVSPGFIDLHTHCDEGLGEPGSNVNLNYLIQGTTTVVTGNYCSKDIKLILLFLTRKQFVITPLMTMRCNMLPGWNM